MLEVFEDENYGFTDSLLDGIKLDDQNINDYLINVNYFFGKKGNVPLILRLKNVKQLFFSVEKEMETYLLSIHTLAHISKKKRNNLVELEIFSAMSFFTEQENDKPLIYCLCEEVYVEK